jgi:RNA polymerase sigma-70 factor (ECF subfamily)
MTKRIARPSARRPLGDRRAQRLRRELLTHLTHQTGDPSLAEDLAQETLAKVLAGLPSFRGDSDLRTWAYRIADNVWRDYLRRRATTPESGGGRDELSVFAVLESLDPSPSETDYDRQRTRECLLDAVTQLPVGERRVVLLHEFGDMPVREIAATLGCSLEAAKQRLRRGRRRLARICRAECRPDTADDGAALCSPNPSVDRCHGDADGRSDESTSRR